jgi:uncharacterized protein YegP (UPF0339 family)
MTTVAQYVVYKDRANEWRWTYFAANSRKIADSAEGYKNKEDCLNGIRIMKASANSPVYEQ